MAIPLAASGSYKFCVFSTPNHFWLGRTDFGNQIWSFRTKFCRLKMVRPDRFFPGPNFSLQSNHCKIVTSKAFNLLNVLRRTMVAQPRLKMWRIRVLSGLAWSMLVLCEIPTLRKTISIQNRTARWILKSRWDPKLLRKWTKSSRDYVLMLNWPSLSIRWICFFSIFTIASLYVSTIKAHLLPQSRDTRSHRFMF